jgi:hypothetical protein
MEVEKGVTHPVGRVIERGRHINRYLLCPGEHARNFMLFHPLNNSAGKAILNPFHR